ncbi:hypothetical protein [Phytohabitans kaempferiae]|uniref:Uncharacterized protein n=1 Tax=Phytohabitans kaempferiae TaxID=1620943 RepID=A0ABV6LX23_9ACTN
MTADLTAAPEADTPPRSRGRARWIAVAVVVVAVAVAAVLLRVVGTGGSSRPPTLQNQLADRVAAMFEQATPTDHHRHGHHTVGESKVLCAAKTLGFEPTSATTVAEVRVFYGYHFCAVIEPGRPWDYAQKLSGPLSVELTEPPVVKVAEGGLGFPDRVRAIIPAPYQEAALQELLDEDQMRDLRKRFDAEAAKA